MRSIQRAAAVLGSAAGRGAFRAARHPLKVRIAHGTPWNSRSGQNILTACHSILSAWPKEARSPSVRVGVRACVRANLTLSQ